MAWCKLEDTFRDHWKFKRLAKELKTSRAEARGLIAGLLSWAVGHSPDGDLTDLLEEEVEEAADWEGSPGEFIRAASLPHVGLIDARDGRLLIHDFMDRSESFKAAKNKAKQREYRKRYNDKKKSLPDSPETVPNKRSEALPRRREEKRREERRSNTPVTVSPASDAASPPAAVVEEPVNGVIQIRQKFLALYAEWYPLKPEYDWDFKRDGRHAKDLLSRNTVEEILQELEAYFGWKNAQVVSDGHTFSHGRSAFILMRRQLNADMGAPQRHEVAAVLRQENYQRGKVAYERKLIGS